MLAASPTYVEGRSRTRVRVRASERAHTRLEQTHHPVRARRGGNGGTSGAESHGLWYLRLCGAELTAVLSGIFFVARTMASIEAVVCAFFVRAVQFFFFLTKSRDVLPRLGATSPSRRGQARANAKWRIWGGSADKPLRSPSRRRRRNSPRCPRTPRIRYEEPHTRRTRGRGRS